MCRSPLSFRSNPRLLIFFFFFLLFGGFFVIQWKCITSHYRRPRVPRIVSAADDVIKLLLAVGFRNKEFYNCLGRKQINVLINTY